MKKVILICTFVFLTGCLGEVTKGYITKNCTKRELINGDYIDTDIRIKSKEGKVENIIITETYDKNMDMESIQYSKKSEKAMFEQTSGITLELGNGIFTYNIDTKNASEIVKEKFKIYDEQHKQIKYYEEDGYKCK